VAIIQDLLDEFSQLASARSRWEAYWRQVALWVLPQTEEFDTLINTGSGSGAVMAVSTTPVAAERSKFVYDMTSLWGIDRLTSGLVSLKTPESDFWHELNVDDDFGYKTNHDEAIALENLRNYLFKIRANPKSGFWPSHKAAIKSMCAFGDGWQFIEELHGTRVPYQYQFLSLPECFPAVGPDGQPNRMFRVFRWTAQQIYSKWGDAAGSKVATMAGDPKRRHERIRVLHAVRPRNDEQRGRAGLRGAQYASWYCLPDDKVMIGEGGYWEFPFTRYAWSNIGQRPFSEGPVAYAIAEIQSLNELAKNELLAVQQVMRPALATAGKNFTRINFNAGAVNPGLMNGNGQPLFAALNTGVRPDLAQQVMETRRNALRETLYLNLWQVLIADVQAGPETATEAMLRAQEKGEMLGPVGISLNDGLSHNVDREVSILSRKNAFGGQSPLAMPRSLLEREVAPAFTSPLDRLRQVGQVIGAQRATEIAIALEQVKPGITARLDADEILELAQEVYGAPKAILLDRKVSKAAQDEQSGARATMANIEATRAGGEAADAAGRGAVSAAAGTQALQQSPQLQQMVAALGRRAQAPQPQAVAA
jgi:hypothetical protein